MTLPIFRVAEISFTTSVDAITNRQGASRFSVIHSAQNVELIVCYHPQFFPKLEFRSTTQGLGREHVIGASDQSETRDCSEFTTRSF